MIDNNVVISDEVPVVVSEQKQLGSQQRASQESAEASDPGKRLWIPSPFKTTG